MTRRLSMLLAFAMLAAASLVTAPGSASASPGAFVFEGVAREDCFGCGAATGHFTGTFTGVVGTHLYTNARMEMQYTSVNIPSQCLLTGTARGTITVSDGTRTDSWDFAWTRTFYELVLITLSGNTGGGGAAATFVITEPIGIPCDSPITVAMHGSGALL